MSLSVLEHTLVDAEAGFEQSEIRVGYCDASDQTSPLVIHQTLVVLVIHFLLLFPFSIYRCDV